MLIRLYSIGFSPNKSKRINVVETQCLRLKGKRNGKRIKRILESTKPFV